MEELESEREDLESAIEDAKNADVEPENNADAEEQEQDRTKAIAAAEQALKEWDEDEHSQELRNLKALADEASKSPNWTYGESLIQDSYFETYARELAHNIGAISSDEGWPLNCIDWEEACEQLQMDYTSVEFDGVTYWIRQ